MADWGKKTKVKERIPSLLFLSVGSEGLFLDQDIINCALLNVTDTDVCLSHIFYSVCLSDAESFEEPDLPLPIKKAVVADKWEGEDEEEDVKVKVSRLSPACPARQETGGSY